MVLNPRAEFATRRPGSTNSKVTKFRRNRSQLKWENLF
jgi:hypothetical protein